MFFAPIFIAIPSFATAPALIFVGFLMFSNISHIKIDEDNYATAIPAYLCIIAMPLFYSIAEGISLGVISYTVFNLACKKVDVPEIEGECKCKSMLRRIGARAKSVSPIMYVLSVLFVLKYIFL